MHLPRRIFLLLLCAGLAHAETELTDRALWEVGVAGAISHLPDYPAADQGRMKWIAAPFGIYRGNVMRADRDGARASFLRSRYYEVDLGIAASFASDSDDNTARQGMPDLDYLLELGPRLSFSLSDMAGKGKLRFFMPVRAVFSTDLSNFHYQGYTLTPALNARVYLGRRDRFFISQLTASFNNRQVNAYFYDVAPEFAQPDRPAYDARAGYVGSDLFLGVVVPTSRMTRFFSGAQMLLHSGSANEGSPLFKNNLNYSLVAGMIWTFYRSPKPAVILD